MNDANVTSTTEAPTELKSVDTRIVSNEAPQVELVATEAEAVPAQKVETEQDEASQETHDEAQDDDAPPAEASGKPKRLQKWMRERLERAERIGRETALAELKAQQEAAKAEPQLLKPDGNAKTLEDFDYDQDAFDDYKVQLRVDAAIKAREERARKTAEQQAQIQAQADFERRKADWEAKAGAGAWEEVISAPIDIPSSMVEMIKDHEANFDIAYWLAKNPAEANRIGKLPPLRMALELARVAETVTAPPQAPQKRITSTPPPPRTLSGSAPAVKSIDNMTTDERIAYWKAQKRAR